MAVGQREFIQGAALAGGAGLWGARARRRTTVFAAAIIGMGGRGRDHMRELAAIPFVEVAAFCDPDASRLDERASEFAKLTGKKPVLQRDVRKVLEDKSIDAVTIATCNHWHAARRHLGVPGGQARLRGKARLSRFLFRRADRRGRQKYNPLAQGGTQRRSDGHVRRAIQALHDGIIGDVYMARSIHYQQRTQSALKTRRTRRTR